MRFDMGGPGEGSASDRFPDDFNVSQAVQWVSQARVNADPGSDFTATEIATTYGGVCDCYKVSRWLEKRYTDACAAGDTPHSGILKHIEFRSLAHDVLAIPKLEEPGPDASEEEQQQYARLKFAIYTGAPQAILDGTAAQYCDYVEKVERAAKQNLSKNLLKKHVLEVAGLEKCVETGVFTAKQHKEFMEHVKSSMGLMPERGKGKIDPFGSTGGMF